MKMSWDLNFLKKNTDFRLQLLLEMVTNGGTPCFYLGFLSLFKLKIGNGSSTLSFWAKLCLSFEFLEFFSRWVFAFSFKKKAWGSTKFSSADFTYRVWCWIVFEHLLITWWSSWSLEICCNLMRTMKFTSPSFQIVVEYFILIDFTSWLSYIYVSQGFFFGGLPATFTKFWRKLLSYRGKSLSYW